MRRLGCVLALMVSACAAEPPSPWQVVDDFEDAVVFSGWVNFDAQNETDPFIPNPQVSNRIEVGGNHFLLRKPAADGVIGNRKAIGLKVLPMPIEVGETATLYTRINVEYFPNNHSYGLSNIAIKEVEAMGYDAFEPMIRITDKAESDGSKNDGTLMVLSDYKQYSKINNLETGISAKPLAADEWYEVWAVINNAPKSDGGQSYDLYMRGGEFETQTKVYETAVFRMGREAPLTAFMAISNTGSKKSPYGNGGVRYDDIYLAKGVVLTAP